jgi:hypothetical protein
VGIRTLGEKGARESLLKFKFILNIFFQVQLQI